MGKGPRVDTSKDDPITQQSEKDDADINVIVERAKRGAVPPVGRNVPPMYGDFADIPTDLRDCLNMAKRAEDLFMSLDPNVRRRFNNDPVEMLDFLNDPKNRDEAYRLGLVVKPVLPGVPPVVPPVEPPVGSSSIEARISALEADVRSDRGDTVK